MSSEHVPDRFEFDAMTGRDGIIRIPRHLRDELNGKKIRVRITPHTLAAQLTRAGVTGEEIDRISEVQREPREQVIRFMLSEGVLAGRASQQTRKGHR